MNGYHSDYNVFANTGWTPTLRHSWNPDNTLPQWQERFKEDLHSTLLPIAFEQSGPRFALTAADKLKNIAPLPEEVRAIVHPHRTSVAAVPPGLGKAIRPGRPADA